MAMVKVVSPSGWDWDAPSAGLVKISSAGLRGEDRREFVKRASGSENVFLPFLDSVKFAADEEPVHLIALGSGERYGANRNGDFFSEKVCRDCHDTFVKFARFYRNHKNKDPKQSYGVVKCSAYNAKMDRVELLVALNKEKSAASRNGGFVADKELEKLAKGEDVAVSMACRVPYDECSYCGNKARTRDDYCTPSMCKAGGCKDNLTRLIKVGGDVHVLHVRNPSPTFFDISNVFRPADRIAYGARADYLDKAACDMGFAGVGGAKMAQDLEVMAPLAVILAQDATLPGGQDHGVHEQVKLAHGLDLLEKSASLGLPGEIRRAFAEEVQPRVDFDALKLDWDRSHSKAAAALGALADRKVILPMREFARMVKMSALAEDAAARLSGVYGRMITDGSLEAMIAGNKYAPAEKLASHKQRREAERVEAGHSLGKSALDRRGGASVVRGLPLPDPKTTFKNEKAAADAPAAEDLARQYAIYKLAALRRIAAFDDDFLLTCAASTCQNQVI